MVQIIQRARSTGDKWGDAFGALGETLGQKIPEEMMGRAERQQLGDLIGKDVSNIRNPDMQKMFAQMGMQQKAKEADFARKVAQYEEITKSPIWDEFNETQKGLIKAEVLGNISAQSAKSMHNLVREREEREAFDKSAYGDFSQGTAQDQMGQDFDLNIIGQEPGFDWEENELITTKPSPQKKPGMQKTGLEAISDEQLQRDRNSPIKRISEGAENEIKRRERQEDIGYKKAATEQSQRQFEHKETKKYAEELEEEASQAKIMKKAIAPLREAIKKGKTGVSARNLIYKHLAAKKSPWAGLFQTKETQAVIDAQKAMAGGFKKLFGSKPTEREFFWYENILPDLLKSGEVNEQIANYYEDIANVQIKAQQIADKITKENGGYRPIDLDILVRERLKPELDKLINKGEDLSNEVMMIDPEGKRRAVNKSDVAAATEAGYKLQ